MSYALFFIIISIGDRMKLFAGLLCAILLVVAGSIADAKAYFLTNNTPAPVTGIMIRTTCGVFGPFGLPAGPFTLNLPGIPPVGCVVTGIALRGAVFPIGYTGPIPPPNPPNGVTVTPNGATFW